MNHTGFSRGANKIKVLLGVSALVIGVTMFESGASADNGWSRQPSWASTTSDNAPVTRRPASKRENSALAPFAPGSNNISLDVGQVFLMGDLSAKYSDSIGSQLHYTYGVSEMFGFDTSLGYSSHSDGTTDGKFSMTTLLAGLRTNLSWYDKVIPHIVFGLGFYRPSYQLASSSLSPVVFGVHVGPGVDLELTKQLFFGAALTFHDVFGTTKMTSEGNYDVGGTYTSFFLRAGLTF